MQNLTLKQADRWLKAGIFSSRQIVEHCLQRIAETDGTLKAWLALNADQALAEAAAADDRRKHGHRRGVLDGVPYACKDLIDTVGLETTAASKVLQGNVPRRDATVVTRLRGAGAQRRLHPRSGAAPGRAAPGAAGGLLHQPLSGGNRGPQRRGGRC